MIVNTKTQNLLDFGYSSQKHRGSFMYDTQEIAQRIKQRAKQLNLTLKDVLPECGLNVNAVSDLAKGSRMYCVSLALIADRLDCSVDWLLGRTSRPEVNR